MQRGRENRISSQIYKAYGYIYIYIHTEYPQLVIRHRVRDVGDLDPT